MLYYLNVEKSNDEVCPSQEGISESAAPAVSGVFQAISAFRFGAVRVSADLSADSPHRVVPLQTVKVLALCQKPGGTAGRIGVSS